MFFCGPYCAVVGAIGGGYFGEKALEAILDPILNPPYRAGPVDELAKKRKEREQAKSKDNEKDCPLDDGDIDCKEWRELLILQGDAILVNFQSGKLSLAEFNKQVKEHNQAVDFYIIECEDPSAETALKL